MKHQKTYYYKYKGERWHIIIRFANRIQEIKKCTGFNRCRIKLELPAKLYQSARKEILLYHPRFKSVADPIKVKFYLGDLEFR